MTRQWGTALRRNKAGCTHDRDALSHTTGLGALRLSTHDRVGRAKAKHARQRRTRDRGIMSRHTSYSGKKKKKEKKKGPPGFGAPHFNPVITWCFEYNNIDRLLVY